MSSVVLAALASRARAGGEVGVVVTGDGAIQPQLTAQIEDWLAQHKHQLIPAPLPPDAVTALHDCFVLDDKGCARDVIDKRARAHAVVFAVVDVAKADNGMRDITLTVYWFEKAHEAMAERRSCARCTDQTLRKTADELMQHLAGTTTKNRGHLKLTSNPGGARVTIDAESIGATPLDFDLAPGNHVVAVAEEHYRRDQRTIAVREGESLAVDVTLERADVVRGDGGGGLARYAPYALMGVGAAALVTGGVMLAIDQDPSPTGPYEIRNTGPAGVGFLIGGAVVGGVGAYLWWRGAHHAAPIAAVSRGGAYVGWLGRF